VLGQYIESMLTDIGGIVTCDREQNKCTSLSSPISCCKISVLSTYSGISKNTCHLYTDINSSSHMVGLQNEDRIWIVLNIRIQFVHKYSSPTTLLLI